LVHQAQDVIVVYNSIHQPFRYTPVYTVRIVKRRNTNVYIHLSENHMYTIIYYGNDILGIYTCVHI